MYSQMNPPALDFVADLNRFALYGDMQLDDTDEKPVMVFPQGPRKCFGGEW